MKPYNFQVSNIPYCLQSEDAVLPYFKAVKLCVTSLFFNRTGDLFVQTPNRDAHHKIRSLEAAFNCCLQIRKLSTTETYSCAVLNVCERITLETIKHCIPYQVLDISRINTNCKHRPVRLVFEDEELRDAYIRKGIYIVNRTYPVVMDCDDWYAEKTKQFKKRKTIMPSQCKSYARDLQCSCASLKPADLECLVTKTDSCLTTCTNTSRRSSCLNLATSCGSTARTRRCKQTWYLRYTAFVLCLGGCAVSYIINYILDKVKIVSFSCRNMNIKKHLPTFFFICLVGSWIVNMPSSPYYRYR